LHLLLQTGVLYAQNDQVFHGVVQTGRAVYRRVTVSMSEPAPSSTQVCLSGRRTN
jgi:hypothetical protein